MKVKTKKKKKEKKWLEINKAMIENAFRRDLCLAMVKPYTQQ